MKKTIQPIFVIGSPRSGTTLLGNFIGSSNHICDMGEYFGFAFTYNKLEQLFTNVPSYYKEKYIASLQKHSKFFVEELMDELNLDFFCDSTPWNLMVVDKLIHLFPNAIFILSIRHYVGVIQSLERSYIDGRTWAGKNTIERAKLYSECYKNISDLPKDRTIPISYDQLCRNPLHTINELKQKLLTFNIDVNEMDNDVFSTSKATNPNHRRQTIAKLNQDGSYSFKSIPSYDPSKWNTELQNMINPYISDVEMEINKMFPGYLEELL